MAEIDEVEQDIAEALSDFTLDWTGQRVLNVERYDEESHTFPVLLAVQGRWVMVKSDVDPTGVEDAGHRGYSVFYVALTTPQMRTAMNRASHLSVGTSGADRYAINRPDVEEPGLLLPYWYIPCLRRFI